VVLGQVFHKIIRLFPINIIPQWFSVRLYHIEDEQFPAGGRSSETYHPIDVNNNSSITLKVTLKKTYFGLRHFKIKIMGACL
jgi:hypothetical protein